MSNFKQITSGYKKKVEVLDERSTPEARAARLKRLRNLANLSRKEMCDGSEININTLKGWEVARYGGLPLDGAHKLIKRVAHEGVFCSIEWLLYGKGSPPRVEIGKGEESSIQNTDKLDEEKHIEKELTLFQQHNSSTLHCQIIDNGMLPFFEKGDWVAGVKRTGEKMEALVGMNCIVQLTTGKVLCRQLRLGKIKNTYHLISIYVDSAEETPILTDTEILCAAPIIWHRKKANTLNFTCNENIRNLACSIGHDIQSPVAALQMLLNNKNNLNEEYKHLLNKVLNSLNEIAADLTS